MPTRAIIARQRGDGWEGRYHHADGYPAGLGAALYALYHGHFQRDIERMLAVLIDEHPAGWSSIIGADWSQVPRYHLAWPDTDTAPACFCHGSRHEPPALYTSDAPQYQDYLYVLSPIGRTMAVFRTPDTETLLAIVRLDDQPPDWSDL